MKTLTLLCALVALAAATAAQNFSATEEVVNPQAFEGAATTNTAATNTPASAGIVAALVATTNEIVITSATAELRTETNYTAIYTGNVKATYGEAELTCDQLTIRAEKGAERPEYMLADRNVVIHHIDKDGKPIRAKSERATYTYQIANGSTNELITLNGDAHIESTSGEHRGEEITWNLTTGVVHSSQQRTILRMKTDAATVPFGSIRTNAP